MPKRRTADANLEKTVKGVEPKRSAASPKPKSAGTHKLTATKKAKQPFNGVSDAMPIASATEPVAAPVKRSFTPSHEEVARLAYLMWERRGGNGGSPEEDWLQAERQLMELSQNR